MIADAGFLPQPPLTGRGVYLLDDHEVVRRGLHHLLESEGLSVVGESGSVREAIRRIPALRPQLAILDNDLPDGSGAEVCRAVAAAGLATRCVLLAGDADEEVLIDSILAGAWGCLSKQDDSSEQLRLIRRALDGHTAYSGRFQPALLGEVPRPGPSSRDERLLALTPQETNVAVRLARGLTNRQISREMGLSEKTIKNMVSAMLTKLGMTRRTQVAVLIAGMPDHVDDPGYGSYRLSLFPDRVAEVTAALLECISETRTIPITDGERAQDALRLADALAATSTGPGSRRPRLSPA